MKSPFKSIKFILIYALFCVLSCILSVNKSFSQGVNNNEWIFGYCNDDNIKRVVSFGRGNEPSIRDISGAYNSNNSAVAVDPITGNVIFYTDGELIYNGDNNVMIGVGNGISGNRDGRQQIAISTLDYEPNGNRLFYTFYISPTGQLQYAVVDMNAPGDGGTGLSPNQPPLGEVISPNTIVGLATGAIAVVKSAQSPSYLISFSGGNLISRRIEDTQGDFTNTDDIAIPFTPKAIIFNDATGQLVLIPEDPDEDLILVDYDTATGGFGAVTTLAQSGGDDAIEGAAFSPDGDYIYFSRGNELLRIPTADLDAEPELVPLENNVFRVYDIKVGPDGRLYYIYEEEDGGPQFMGRVDNPDEEDIAELEIDEDPFGGVDFCGRVFPQFAPNADVEAEVDFSWQPEEQCSNNPLQLTSSINPQNYRPVSFEWTFEPELTDEDGEPLDIDYNQEHLLLPAEATSGESVTATLTVTFADGSTSSSGPKTINLLPNDLEANFTPQDTTVCESCFDLMPLLEVQQGEGGQGPGGPGGPGVGGPGGGGGNYEYFWSNKRDEGWGPEAPNEICEPGLYWVLVREPQSSCYVYASIRVRMWDVDDQSNNVWYFGDQAGMDFNPDPDDPEGPMPRPVSHPNNIPAGTTTISDETGQVLFYTDGSTVWDLNGNIMENGEDIGGSNQASEGVIAVAIPQEETIFYLFTTSTATDGSSQVKFSLVDIKAENQNPNGVGNVVTKDNFLFSPATQHSAAIAAGDTTWVLFHELGNNTFRAYPVGTLGIGPPVFSSVGSTHGFDTGVGSMKFSPDGSKVAVTIQDGACSRVELFDFDQSTGRLTEYALVDLNCNGDDVYGVEFSNDSDRIFVTYTGNGGKVEEFIIQSPNSDDEDDDLSCAACFESATSSAQRAQCILDSRNDLEINGPIGAIQMGPLGDIYVARPGQSFLGTIRPGSLCEPSIGTTDGFELLAGTTSNLGLPSFVQQSGSSIPEPAISGPERLCLDPENGAEGIFEGAGEPDIDSYFWTIEHEDGEVVFEGGGPGEENQTLTFFFQREGLHTVTLVVDRCDEMGYYSENNSIEVLVVAPPEITLEDDVTLCSGTPVTLTAIDGYDPAEGLYDFEWRNAAGFQFGDENSNEITVDEESIYTVTVSFRNTNEDDEFFDACPASKSVFVGPAFEFELTQTAEEVCYDESLVVFAPDTPVSGEWFYQLEGSPDRVQFPIGEAFELEITPALDLPSPGFYQIIFVTEDPIVPGCLVERVLELEVFPLPNFEIREETPATDCDSDDGFFEVEVLIDLSELEIMETGELFDNVSAGDVFTFTDLAPGNYTIRGQTSFGCEFIRTATILNLDPPAELVDVSLDSTDEDCGINEILPGSITIELITPPTGAYTYTITRQGDGEVRTGVLDGQVTLIQDLRHGDYEVQVEDENGCAIPVGEVTIERRFLVDFSVPSNVIACENFELDILTQQNLIFTVIDPNGNEVSPDGDGIYLLTESGEYIVYGEGQAGEEACPRERRINLVVNDAIQFDISDVRVDCVDGISYDAILNGTDPADVFFFWRNDVGTVVGRSQTFRPRTAGDYTLDVQPRVGSNCPTPPLAFTVEEFDNEIEYEVEVVPFCTDSTFALIEITGDLNGLTIEWYRLVAGISIIMTENSNSFRAEEEGIYEFVIRNTFGCVVGREQISIRQSSLVAPELEAEYKICEIENLTPTIDPGQYENYEWYLVINEEETELVSTDATFTPTVAGNYRLIVFDDLGCEEAVDFVVVEDCNIMVRFPNAMNPSADDPKKQFEVYASEFVDEFSVFIYNRWGELIFYCEENNLQRDRDLSRPLCQWDGTVNGKIVPIGTYPVVVRFRSNNQNITKTLRDAILVIE